MALEPRGRSWTSCRSFHRWLGKRGEWLPCLAGAPLAVQRRPAPHGVEQSALAWDQDVHRGQQVGQTGPWDSPQGNAFAL